MRPGRAPASATSKPIIVGHRPQVRDTSVTLAGSPPASPQFIHSHQKIQINTGGADTPATPVSPVGAPAPASVPNVSAAPVSSAMPITVSSAGSGTPQSLTPSVSVSPPAAPAVAVQVDHLAAGDSEDDLLGAMPAPSVNIEPAKEITISPHVPKPKTIWRWIIPIAIVVVVGLVVLDLLLDASFITMGIPHTHFF